MSDASSLTPFVAALTRSSGGLELVAAGDDVDSPISVAADQLRGHTAPDGATGDVLVVTGGSIHVIPARALVTGELSETRAVHESTSSTAIAALATVESRARDGVIQCVVYGVVDDD